MNHDICAVILAAGKSTRMGQTKQLLQLGGEFLLEKVIRKALSADFASVYTVIGHEAERMQNLIAIEDNRFHWLINSEYHEGQSTSLKKGLQKALQQHSHVMVFLGDLPFISEHTIQKVLRDAQAYLAHHSAPFVVQPTRQGIAGHPVFLGNLQLEPFLNIAGDEGGKRIMNNMVRIQLEIDDPGILSDIDTPVEYEKAKKLDASK